MNVTICSRKAAEELLRTDALSHTAVISFCDPPSTDRPAPRSTFIPMPSIRTKRRPAQSCKKDWIFDFNEK